MLYANSILGLPNLGRIEPNLGYPQNLRTITHIFSA
jgi:hypothetical protein